MNVRALLYTAATVLFTFSVTTIPLAETYSLAFLAPMFITFLSVAVLKEKVAAAGVTVSGSSVVGAVASEGEIVAALLGNDPDGILEWWDVLDLLEQFPSARPPVPEMIAALSPLQPRLYSISSSLPPTRPVLRRKTSKSLVSMSSRKRFPCCE